MRRLIPASACTACTLRCRLPLDDPDRFRVEVLFRWAGGWVCGRAGGWVVNGWVGGCLGSEVCACEGLEAAALGLCATAPLCSINCTAQPPPSPPLPAPPANPSTACHPAGCACAAPALPTTPRWSSQPRRTTCCLWRPAWPCTPRVGGLTAACWRDGWKHNASAAAWRLPAESAACPLPPLQP